MDILVQNNLEKKQTMKIEIKLQNKLNFSLCMSFQEKKINKSKANFSSKKKLISFLSDLFSYLINTYE